jgi:hypothetical protein
MNQKEYLKTYFEKAEKCLKQLRDKLPKDVKILTSQHTDPENLLAYFEASQVFNTRLQQNPLAIVYCKTKDHVSITYKTAIENEIPIRVRAGGHDHEGESSGTNVITIDVSEMTHVEVDKSTGIAKIGAGIRFIDLTKALADKDVMIAHGTCATVCITGFTLGGGWGPWTRKMGMNCEHLKGATIMLGNGEVIDVDEDANGNVPDLLWALRGGGGLSYGIVTELRIQTFALPEELIKFELHWNHYDDKEHYPKEDFPTLRILEEWEKVITADNTPKLIGTNLKINARPSVDELFNYETISHGCCMYGYWEGTEEQLLKFVNEQFAKVPPPVIKIDGEGGIAPKNPKERYIRGLGLASGWDRESFIQVNAKINMLDMGDPIPPDLDQPAPHKITSRLVNKEGLGPEGHEQLLLSLTSPLVQLENRSRGLFTYVTLGAIVGDYYRSEKGQNNKSAFPYKDRLYTIQYQTWWNEADSENGYHNPSQKGEVYKNINLALDWMDTVRDFDIPNTSGAFISFKDSSIPTSVYFGESYEALKRIKADCSHDPDNHLRTRKTII